MGDRTWVNLTIMAKDKDRAHAIFEEEERCPETVDEAFTIHGVALISCGFGEVNYADLGFEEKLQEHKIPYDKEWHAGQDYSSGAEYHRINENGESVVKRFYGDEQGMVKLDELLKAIEDDNLSSFVDDSVAANDIIAWSEQATQ